MNEKIFAAATAALLALTGLYIWFVAFHTPAATHTPKEIAAALSGLENLEPGNDSALKRCFGLTGGELGDYIYYRSADVMNVEELLIVRVKDRGALDRLETAVQKRLNTQKQNFTGYGTTQLAALENAVVAMRGDYFFYAVGENAERWEAAFSAALRR